MGIPFPRLAALAVLAAALLLCAATADSSPTRPVLQGPVSRPAEPAPSSPDSAAAPSAFVDSLEARMNRGRLTRPLARVIFQRTPSDLEDLGSVQPGLDLLAAFRGFFIRRIEVVRLDDFSGRDNERFGGGGERALQRVGRALHARTREQLVRKYLLMREGEPLDPHTVADTERLLRATSFLREAEIVPLTVEGTIDSVDLLVIVRDVWSLGLVAQAKSATSASVRVTHRNVAGRGDQLAAEIQYDAREDRALGFEGSYGLENIAGSFVRNTYTYRSTAKERSGRFELARDRVAPQIRAMGALALALRRLDAYGDEPEQERLESLLWAGRAYRLGGDPDEGPSRAAFIAAAGIDGLDFLARPDSVTADSNKAFHDRVRVLVRPSVSTSDFRKERFLYGYGRTEDIPAGALASLTAGVELGEFATRGYTGAEIRGGGHTRAGHFDGALAVGAFFRSHAWEDGVLDLSGRWFSDLGVTGRYGHRVFATVAYTHGFERPAGDVIALADGDGLDVLRGDPARGRTRLAGALEPVLFTPWTSLGFRVALFSTLSAGTVGTEADAFLRGAYFSSVGFGLRVQNPRLILDPIEIRFAVALRKPDDASVRAVRFGNQPRASFEDFEPGAPGVIEYR